MVELKELSVLIIHASVDESSRLSSVLDNSGFKIRATQVSSRDELDEELRGSKLDIVLSHKEYTTPSPKDVIQALNRLNRDVPVLIIVNELTGVEIAQGLRMGASDVVAIDEDQHLVAVVNRELKRREERSQQRETLSRFYASENKYQQLLQYARLPMAIVHESMFVLVNDAFAELFEIDKSEIEALPIVDILDKRAQQEYKKIYKKFNSAPDSWPGLELTTSCTSPEGEKLQIQIDFSTVKYNDEDCLQLKIEPSLTQTANPVETIVSSPTVPRTKLIQHIESCINIAHSQKKDSSIVCIEIDAFEQLQETLGIGASDSLYSAVTDFVVEFFDKRLISNFDNNNLIILLGQTDSNSSKTIADEFCQKVDSNVFEFGDNSQQITVTAGISIISDLSTNADTVVKQSIRACEQWLATKEDGIGNGAHLYEPEKSDTEGDVDINYLLKQAFKHTHLQTLFQPMMKFRGEASKNYEVLLGIKPEHKETYPADFIAQATRSNENDEIDRWVILETMKTLLKKQNCGGDEHLYLHISKQSLQNPKFGVWLDAVIKKSRLNTKQLTFQLREVDVSSNLNSAAAFIKLLQNFGCASVITHFGSSVQPMKILEQIPFTYAKIDGSFTLEAQRGDSKNLIKMLNQLTEKNVKAIVPMVESATILPVLWKSNVSYIQGYYVQAPADKMDYKFE